LLGNMENEQVMKLGFSYYIKVLTCEI